MRIKLKIVIKNLRNNNFIDFNIWKWKNLKNKNNIIKYQQEAKNYY